MKQKGDIRDAGGKNIERRRKKKNEDEAKFLEATRNKEKNRIFSAWKLGKIQPDH